GGWGSGGGPGGGGWSGIAVSAGGSSAAEAPRRLDRLELAEIELADCLKGLGGGAFLEVVGQGVEPRLILGLQREQVADGVAPAPGSAALIGGSASRAASSLTGFALIPRR